MVCKVIFSADGRTFRMWSVCAGLSKHGVLSTPISAYHTVEEGSAGWGTYLNAAQTIKEHGLLQENPFWKGGGLVWSEPFDHPFFIKHPFCHASGMHSVIYSSFSSNHPG